MYTPFSALTVLAGQQEGHPACKKLGVGLLVALARGSCHRHFYRP